MNKKNKSCCKGIKSCCKNAVGKVIRHSKKDGFFKRIWKSICK